MPDGQIRLNPPGELPPAGIARWTPGRKAAVVEAVAAKRLSRQDACRQYGLSSEELVEWQRAYRRRGINGLRSTRLGVVRRKG